MGFASATGLGGSPQEQHLTVPLAQFQHQQVRLRFSFATLDSLFNSYSGWFVDHMNVTDDLASGGYDYTYNASDWTGASDFGTAPGWHLTTKQSGVFGDQPWWYGNEATGTYETSHPISTCLDSSDNSGTLTSQPIDLGSDPVLSFDTLWQIESIAPALFDLMRVQVIPTGYAPGTNGFPWHSPADSNVPYDNMASDYPADTMTYPWGAHTIEADAFYQHIYQPIYGGLCYGTAASSAYFFNDSPQRPVGTYGLFPQPDSPMPFPFDSKTGVPVKRLLERFHSRQLAEYGFGASATAYRIATATGNATTWSAVAKTTAGGTPVVVTIVPSSSTLNNNPFRWAQLFGLNHTVVAYATSTASNGDKIINVYDPDAPGDAQAKVIIDPSGGLQLHSTGNDLYGGGTINTTKGPIDYGQPGEWQATALPDDTFLDGSSNTLFGDNTHWILDLPRTLIPFTLGAVPSAIPQNPVILGQSPGTPMPLVQVLPPGQAFSTTINTATTGAQTGAFAGNHVALAQETDPAAAGSSRDITIGPAATSIQLSAASAGQQYTLTLGADYLPSYGRQITLTGVGLPPGVTVNASSTTTATGSLTLSSTAPADQQASATITERAQAGSTATATVVIPGLGATATVTVNDWADPAHSLIYETINRAATTQTLILQDNPAQRASLITQLYQQLQTTAAQIPGHGPQNSIISEIDASQARFQAGDPAAASGILAAMQNEVNAQAGTAIPADLAATLTTDAKLIQGFLLLA